MQRRGTCPSPCGPSSPSAHSQPWRYYLQNWAKVCQTVAWLTCCAPWKRWGKFCSVRGRFSTGYRDPWRDRSPHATNPSIEACSRSSGNCRCTFGAHCGNISTTPPRDSAVFHSWDSSCSVSTTPPSLVHSRPVVVTKGWWHRSLEWSPTKGCRSPFEHGGSRKRLSPYSKKRVVHCSPCYLYNNHSNLFK